MHDLMTWQDYVGLIIGEGLLGLDGEMSSNFPIAALGAFLVWAGICWLRRRNFERADYY